MNKRASCSTSAFLTCHNLKKIVRKGKQQFKDFILQLEISDCQELAVRLE